MQEQYKKKRQELLKALSEIICDLRKNSKKSANLFANEIEISKTTILKMEKGLLDPQLSTFCRIANALNMSPSKLLELVEKKLPKNWDFLDI
ncbi:MAG: helix-turn-helix transcriptional regulator [Candidatus Gastranaerophilales bacterium]|nr:helix-turn-helix transcriptional regulator [Candidatus Gastranaerophilales bacterium]